MDHHGTRMMGDGDDGNDDGHCNDDSQGVSDDLDAGGAVVIAAVVVYFLFVLFVFVSGGVFIVWGWGVDFCVWVCMDVGRGRGSDLCCVCS